MTERIYLDWNATAPLRHQARAAAMAAFEIAGNPSSVHAEGRAARRLIEDARDQVAALVGAEPRNVVFTSGGTEANMLALAPASGTHGKALERLLVSAIEHPSVLAGGRFAASAVERVPATGDGRIDLAALAQALAASKDHRALVSLMLANNETGVVQPVSEAARLTHEAGGVLHVDAVQAAGRISCDINGLCADLLTISGHKIYGPKGIGALYVRRSAPPVRLEPLIDGGGQESGFRSGTLNVPGIVGFATAVDLCLTEMDAEAVRLAELRHRLFDGLVAQIPDVALNGPSLDVPGLRLPGNLNLSFAYIEGESLLMGLKDIAVSTGSACTSASLEPSYVLKAIGLADELAYSAIRFGLGRFTSEAEIDYTVKRVVEEVRRLREMSPVYKAKKGKQRSANAKQ
jgi:cysteine desulfurase